jgi:23S rRNA maturation mini-RNase III
LKSGTAKKAAEYRFYKKSSENNAAQGLLFMKRQINTTTG